MPLMLEAYFVQRARGAQPAEQPAQQAWLTAETAAAGSFAALPVAATPAAVQTGSAQAVRLDTKATERQIKEKSLSAVKAARTELTRDQASYVGPAVGEKRHSL